MAGINGINGAVAEGNWRRPFSFPCLRAVWCKAHSLARSHHIIAHVEGVLVGPPVVQLVHHRGGDPLVLSAVAVFHVHLQQRGIGDIETASAAAAEEGGGGGA